MKPTDRVIITVAAPALPPGFKLQASSDERHAIQNMLRMNRFAEDFRAVLAQQEAVEAMIQQQASSGEEQAEPGPPGRE